MAASYDFLALPEDFALLETWLHDHGAVRYGGQAADGAIVMHFPQFGPISLWPEKPNLDPYKPGGAEWKAAVISGIVRAQDHTPRVNQLESPVAGVVPPVFDPRGFWRSSDIWFRTPALHKRFPGLAAVSAQLARWFRKHPTVFDDRRKEPMNDFPFALHGFFYTRLYALPAAYRHLTSGGAFVQRITSAKSVNEFLQSRSEPVA
jgi:hypothetical protein